MRTNLSCCLGLIDTVMANLPSGKVLMAKKASIASCQDGKSLLRFADSDVTLSARGLYLKCNTLAVSARVSACLELQYRLLRAYAEAKSVDGPAWFRNAVKTKLGKTFASGPQRSSDGRFANGATTQLGTLCSSQRPQRSELRRSESTSSQKVQ